MSLLSKSKERKRARVKKTDRQKDRGKTKKTDKQCRRQSVRQTHRQAETKKQMRESPLWNFHSKFVLQMFFIKNHPGSLCLNVLPILLNLTF